MSDLPETSHVGKQVSVCVCIVTKLRPQMLTGLLNSLAEQRMDASMLVTVRLVVIDNDPAGSARTTVEDVARVRNVQIDYGIEAKPGIPAARNKSIALAGEVDYIAFIDDDEVANPHWISSLLRTSQIYNADIVIGPVLPIFEETTPTWIAQSGLFDRDHYPTGAIPRWGRTSNALVSKKLLDGISGPFAERLTFTGGSDTQLFELLKMSGAQMVWSEEAYVTELIPATRATVGWLLQRQFRLGNSAVWIDRQLPKPGSRLLKRLVEGGVFFAVGLCALIPYAVLGRTKMVKALGAIYRGSGIVSGMVGYKYEEYRRLHGG
jgi:succinoglycan biosynthesis protein ExoM